MRVLLAVALALATVPSVEAARDLGTATLLSGPEACGRADCYQIQVSCPEVAVDAIATLRVRGPELSTAANGGTIYMATGGGGGAFWGDAYGKPARRAIKKLRRNGYLTVEINWDDRWLNGSPDELEGHVRLACRPATAARWIYDNLHPAGTAAPFCATGNSGGSSQVSYMLSHYGLEDILTTVVPSSGPPMTRIDLGCFGEQDPELPNMIYGTGARETIDRSFGFFNGQGPCATQDTSSTRMLRQNSVSGLKDRRYVFEDTMVWFVFGNDDIGSAVGQGLMLYDRLVEVGSPLVGISMVNKTPHAAPSAKKGANKIRDVLLDHCVLRE